MVYCTLIYGKDWHEKYARTIREEAELNDIYILTSHPEYFNECRYVEKYPREEFSYYEKLNWVLSLVKKLKQRVTYIDADWVYNLAIEVEAEEDMVYTNQFSIAGRYLKNLTETGRQHLRDLFLEAKYTWEDNNYLSEKIISIPYMPDRLDKIIQDIVYLQPFFENTHNADSKLPRPYKRYVGVGVGFAEGAALTAVLDEHKIKYISKSNLFRRKDLLM